MGDSSWMSRGRRSSRRDFLHGAAAAAAVAALPGGSAQARERAIFERLRAAHGAWNAAMLPYPAASAG